MKQIDQYIRKYGPVKGPAMLHERKVHAGKGRGMQLTSERLKRQVRE
jgi:hypothetical protein